MESVQSSPSNATYNSAYRRLQFNPQLNIQTNIGIYGLRSNGPSMQEWSAYILFLSQLLTKLFVTFRINYFSEKNHIAFHPMDLALQYAQVWGMINP
jgi:hypothetical protein